MGADFGPVLDWVQQRTAAGMFPTAVVGIATSSGTVELGAFGSTGGREVRSDDRFRLFSITKPLVGLLVGRAMERGLLSLDTPLRRALPDFGRDRDDEVRLGHLVSHRSGVVEPPLDAASPLRPYLLAPGRAFTAGAVLAYSSLAFDGITALLDDAVGWGWEEQLADLSAAVGADFTFDEAADPVPLVPLPGFDAARFAALRHPGAGAIARAEDLLALGSSLLAGDGRAVRPATLEMMRRPLTQGVPRLDRLAPWDGHEYGVTFNLRYWRQGLIDPQVFGHSGWAGTEFWIHPELDLCWTLLTNTPDRPGFELDALDNLIVSCAS